MTIEKQAIALVKFQGWHHLIINDEYGPNRGLRPFESLKPNCHFTDLPAYDKDLNAINEFENWLEDNHPLRACEYTEVLNNLILEKAGIKVTKWSMLAGIFRMVSAKSDVKLEALVKTLDLWED